MSSIKSGYKKLGLEPVDPLQDWSCRARIKSMGDEKKDDGERDTFKMFLQEALT
jgi:hypothetical protein